MARLAALLGHLGIGHFGNGRPARRAGVQRPCETDEFGGRGILGICAISSRTE
jgi:hypothetical protein